MKQKELLLWVVAIAALTLSLIAVIGPKGLKSDASMMQYSVQQQQLDSENSTLISSCATKAKSTFKRCLDRARGDLISIEDCSDAYKRAKAECEKEVSPIPVQNDY